MVEHIVIKLITNNHYQAYVTLMTLRRWLGQRPVSASGG